MIKIIRSLSGIEMVAISVAISLQVLMTIGGVRVGLSDLVLVPVLLWIALKWIKLGQPSIVFHARGVHWWLAALTIWLWAEIILGRVELGYWSRWAVINKGIGWLILMGYFTLGVGISALWKNKVVEFFFSYVVFVAFIIAIFSLEQMYAFIYWPDFFIDIQNTVRLEGFFANPNAYGISMSVFILIQLILMKQPSQKNRRFINDIILGVLILSVFIAGSRSSWIGGIAGIFTIIVLRRASIVDFIRPVIISLGMCMLFIYGPNMINSVLNISGSSISGSSLIIPFQSSLDTIDRGSDVGIEHRLKSIDESITAWKASPLVGTGIGLYRVKNEGRNDIAQSIHTTALWLLTETGVIGILLFCGFLFSVIKGLYRHIQSGLGNSWYAEMALFPLIVIIIASLGTEILYQRYIWVFLGIGLFQNLRGSKITNDHSEN